MRSLISHPTSTHTTYFGRTPLPQKQEIPKKCDDDVIITFFQVLIVFGVEGVRQKYALWLRVGCEIKFRIQRALPIKI